MESVKAADLTDGTIDMTALRDAYRAGVLRPTDVAASVAERIAASDDAIWIHRASRAELVAAARRVEERQQEGARLPLYGLPFAVKDNIDVAGCETTAACPAYARRASSSATVVQRLIDAGALFAGKTNLDQLATGLVGVRSPYGVPPNPFDARAIPGGSSSGSAVAVARGLVSFALGTDTAGSGRVPAAFNNIVGLKPTRGLISTAGVVPACRTIDCVSIFALTCEDAVEVAAVAAGHDPADPASSPDAGRARWLIAALPATFRFGVPAPPDREFFGDEEAARLFDQAIARLSAMGGEAVEIPFAAFREAAALLYDGPWIADRLAPFEDLVDRDGALLPVTREILLGGRRPRGVDVFRAVHRLEALRRDVRVAWAEARIDALVAPTTPTIYTVAEVMADPLRLNARLGHYTNFVNLLGLAALAVPNGMRGDGLPSGISFIGPAHSDARLCAFGAAYHRRLGGKLGATDRPFPAPFPPPSMRQTDATAASEAASEPEPEPEPEANTMRLAVVGLHLTGQPLNHQLTDLGARLAQTCRTVPHYRLFARPTPSGPKPGLIRVGANEAGAAIEVEVWEIARAAFGAFFAGVRAPLCIGTIELENGEVVPGFLCEPHGLANAEDVSAEGGWRAFLRARA